MNNQEVSTAYVGSTEIKEARLGTQLVLAPGGDALWYKSNEIPTLDLRFADNKSLVDATTGANLVTFSRASSATYTDSQGVIRNAVTNLNLRSQEFDNAVWTQTGLQPFGSGSVANATTAPDGTLTADKLVEDTSTGAHSIIESTATTYTSGLTYTFSFFVKKAERQTLQILLHPNPFPGALSPRTAIFNSNTGLFVSVGSAYTGSSVESLADGWYRVSMSSTADATTTGNFTIGLCSDDIGTSSYTGDGTSGIYIWGAQLEQSSTVGEYIPTTSTINSAPRFDHDPTTGESLGLLVEEARTNLLVRSEEFEATWGLDALQPFGSGSTANAISAPSGLTTADLIVEDTATSTHGVSQGASVTSGASYTFSVFAKAEGRTYMEVVLPALAFGTAVRAELNLSTGEPLLVTGTGTISSTAYLNGWYRLAVTATATSSVSATVSVRIKQSSGAASYTGDGTSGIYIWGAQLEASAFPTSYIPTTSATATRAADVANISGSNFSSWFNYEQSTALVEFEKTFAGAFSTFGSIFAVSDGTGTNRTAFAHCQGGIASIYSFSNVSGSNVLTYAPYNVSTPASYKYALAIATNSARSAASGQLLGSADDTSVSVSNLVNQAYIDAVNVIHIKRLTYWPQRLSNATLQTITL